MNIHEHPHYSFVKAILIYSVAILFLFYEMGLQVSPSVMTNELMQSFHLDAAGLGVVSGFYFYSYSLMQLPVGLLFDRFGARILITIAIFGCAVGAFFFGNMHTAAWAAFARLIMGFGSAFAFTGVLVVAARWFRPHHFAMLGGFAQFFAAFGAMGGAYPLAFLIAKMDWRIVIIGLSFLGVVLSVIAWLVIRDSPKEKIAADVFHNPKIKESLVRIFSNPQTWWLALYSFAGWGPMVLFAALWDGPFLKVKFVVSNQVAASSLSFIWLGVALASPLQGWLSDKLKNRCLLMIISPIIGLVGAIVLIYGMNLPFWISYICLFMMGVASASQILSFAVVKDINPPTSIATAVGFNNMAVVMGGAIFQPLVGFILQWNWDGTMVGTTPFYSMHDYAIALSIIPLCFLVCIATSIFLIKETHCKPSY